MFETAKSSGSRQLNLQGPPADSPHCLLNLFFSQTFKVACFRSGCFVLLDTCSKLAVTGGDRKQTALQSRKQYSPILSLFPKHWYFLCQNVQNYNTRACVLYTIQHLMPFANSIIE